MNSKIVNTNEILKILSSPNGLRIVMVLGKLVVCNAHICKVLNLSQPLVSVLLKNLNQAGIVDIQKHGLWRHYQLAEWFLNSDLLKSIKDLVAQEAWFIKDLANLKLSQACECNETQCDCGVQNEENKI